jgi:endonuclease III
MALLQEGLRSEPWHLLKACVLLNRTRGTQVREVLPVLDLRWPDAGSMAEAAEEDVAEAIRTLGLQRRRAATLVAMARAWLELEEAHGSKPPQDAVATLPGVGAYVLDSYRIFVNPGRLLVPDSGDKRLSTYVRWAAARAAGARSTG